MTEVPGSIPQKKNKTKENSHGSGDARLRYVSEGLKISRHDPSKPYLADFRPESSHVSLKNTVELKIVNEVGSSSTDPIRALNSRPLTPPSLDIVEEELAKLGRETDVDADVDGDDGVAASSQKLLQNNDVDDFYEDDLVRVVRILRVMKNGEMI